MLSGNDAPYDYAWLLGEAVAAFSSHSLPYCLIGAVTLGAHGRPRATQDLDLLILADRMGSDAYLISSPHKRLCDFIRVARFESHGT